MQNSLCKTSLRLSPLVKDVIKRNPDLAATNLRVKAATHVIPRVKTLDDPQFLFRSINHPIGSKREFIHERRFKFAQNIPFPGKLRLKGEMAEHRLDFACSEEIATHQELILQTKRLYYQLYFNKEARRINRNNRDIVARFINGALAAYKTGKQQQADTLKAHVEMQMLDEELLVLEAERLTIISMLNALLNYPQSHSIGEPEQHFYPCVKLNYEGLEYVAMRKRPELQGLQALVEEERARARLAKREYAPDFTLELMLQQRPDRDKLGWGGNIGFNIPIWIGRKQRQEVQEAEAQALANQSNLFGMRAKIRGRIREILAKIQSAEERIALYKTGLIPKTIETLGSFESAYRTGRGDFLILLDTRRQLQDFELKYEGARAEREILLAELEREIGMSLDDACLVGQRKCGREITAKVNKKCVPFKKKKWKKCSSKKILKELSCMPK